MTRGAVLGETFERMLMAAGKDEKPSKPVVAGPRCGQLLDGRYLVVEHLASGGMGSVYKATQRPLDRTVAVKFLDVKESSRAELERRFFLEACLCARLSHPNTVRVFDYGQSDEQTFYIVMEYLDGRTLAQVVDSEGSIASFRVMRMTMQVCAALSEAHEQGLVHRDIKLSNLFLVNQPFVGDFTKVLDFGLVKEVGVERGETRMGIALGSPLFMSPEQIQGGVIDGRTDIYGLGIAMFVMLTGQPPFEAGRRMGRLFRDHLVTAPPSMASVRPDLDIPEALEAITQRALQKRPEDRFATTRDMLHALQECEQQMGGTSAMVNDGAPRAVEFTSARSTAVNAEFDAHTMTQLLSTVGAESGVDVDVPTPEPSYLRESGTDVASADLAEVGDEQEFARLRNCNLSEFFLYIDLNCPFCFALHERLAQWGLSDTFSVRMVEHASHLVDGPFGVEQEVVLANEVYALHHRAPDVELSLPPRRFCSKLANRLLSHVQKHHVQQLSTLRRLLYRAVWHDGEDIGDREVILGVLSASGLSATLLEHAVEEPPELAEWQRAWEEADFDCCIPALQHGPTKRMLVGLPTRQSLLEFLVEKKSRVVDSAVCYYQRKPVVLVCGGMQRLWPLIAPMRRYCDFLPAGSLNDAQKSLRARALPDLVLVEQGWGSGDSMVLLASECKARGVSWIVAALETPSVGEVAALSAGAAEFLTVDANLELARLRFERVLRDRLSVEERQRGVSTDGLTGLGSRRRFTQKIEGEWARLCRQQKPVSLLLIDIDLFAEFNEDYGYLVGDESLERLAGLWDVVVTRPSDMLARFGGNQVIGLFPGSDATALSPLAERMRALAVEANIEHEQSEYDAKLTVSIGLASCIPDQESSVHELLDLVHEACGEAREAGGNQVVVRLA